MLKRKIKVNEYSKDWPNLFNEEKKVIIDAIGNIPIEHIGSTAVPGLSSKPVIDMMAEVGDLSDVDAFIKPLEEIGYKYIPELESQTPDRRFFQKRINDIPKYHLSFTQPTSEYRKDHILFRDYLRKHLSAAKEYENLKTNLAKEFVSDFDAYNEGKTAFIKEIIRKAKEQT